MDRHAHWEQVYRTKSPEQASWFQAEATLSLSLIGSVMTDYDRPILDVGAGASVLVDGLLDAGYRNISVLDIAEHAMDVSRERLGERATQIRWLTGDVLTVDLPPARFSLWHDRAAFHFLTNADDRRRYVAQVERALHPGGHIILATFAEDGPEKCSGLPVVRYSAEALQAELGEAFEPVSAHRELHPTPAGGEQAFTYIVSRRS